MKKYIYLLLVVFISTAVQVFGQELNCTVTITTDQMTRDVAQNNKGVYKEMKTAFENFMNSRVWTEDEFEEEERINCRIVVNLTSQLSVGSFRGNAQIQASRPVYGSDYETITLNYIDKNFDFQYLEGQPMEYNDNTFTNNLTSLLAFYAYIIIGLDYDSFGDKAGTRFHEKSLNIVNNSQQAGGSGWRSSESQVNRFWLADNLNSQQLLNYREAYYKYHRLAMDTMIEDPVKAQQQIKDVLMTIRGVRKIVQISILLDAFFDTKVTELVDVYSEGDMQLRTEVYNLLRGMDATHNAQYIKILGK